MKKDGTPWVKHARMRYGSVLIIRSGCDFTARVSSDAGLFPYRDLDDAAKLTESAVENLLDFRTGTNIQHGMTALLRQSIFSRLAGYEDVNGAERLSVDPVMRHVVGGRAARKRAASTSQVGRFETDVLRHQDNLKALMSMPGKWVDLVHRRRPLKKLILDMDSSVIEPFFIASAVSQQSSQGRLRHDRRHSYPIE